MTAFEPNRRQLLGYSVAGSAAAMAPSWALGADPGIAGIDAIVSTFMTSYDIPGVAVAVVRTGRPVLLNGY